MGTGVYGAAGAGVLCQLWKRGLEPYAVCGLGAGAWPAALFAAGADARGLAEAAALIRRMGKRLLPRSRSYLKQRQTLFAAERLEHLLTLQTSGRVLALCPKRAVFPVRMARQERDVVFSTQSFSVGDSGMLAMQASLAFAVRAAIGLAPFLSPCVWMGQSVLPQMDAAAGVKLLLAMGAQRVLVVEPVASPRHTPDALELAALCAQPKKMPLPEGAAKLAVVMPDGAYALDTAQIPVCMEAGERAAERDLDPILEEMGLAACRVLPFRRMPIG